MKPSNFVKIADLIDEAVSELPPSQESVKAKDLDVLLLGKALAKSLVMALKLAQKRKSKAKT
jgi:hypothetical protein